MPRASSDGDPFPCGKAGRNPNEKYFYFFEKRLDKKPFVWYTITVNEAKPPGFHPAAVSEPRSIDFPLKELGGSLCAGAVASVRFYF
jgi:hypothetical protein